MNIALFQYGIEDLKGGGGAERFFADFFDAYNASPAAKNKLYYILDNSSVRELRNAGKLKSQRNILRIKLFSNRFKLKLESLQLKWLIFRHRIKVIHVPLYDRTYLPLLKVIDRLPGFLRPKIVIQIVNCVIPHALMDTAHPDHTAVSTIYLPLFNELRADGYFSWYEVFVNYVNKGNVLKHKPKQLAAAKWYYADTKKYSPQSPKQKLIVFAARLVNQKHPEWVIEALGILKEKHFNEIEGWQFIIFGAGPLRQKLEEDAAKKQLTDLLSFKVEDDLSIYFNKSKIFISCQDYENYTSLSMIEAMSAGNALIARNVGQTSTLLHENENGIFILPDSPMGLANAILKLIKLDPAQLEVMGKKSVELYNNTHNSVNFIKQMDAFWDGLFTSQD